MDFTDELAELMEFVADVAVDIRTYSAYGGIRINGDGRMVDCNNDPDAPYDLMYLADILHNYSSLGNAIKEGNVESIIQQCDSHIATYECYLGKCPERLNHMQGNPVETFKRHERYVNIKAIIPVFEKIKSKCMER